jgi:hypothetical protein
MKKLIDGLLADLQRLAWLSLQDRQESDAADNNGPSRYRNASRCFRLTPLNHKPPL